jgi:hypothetical protein
VRLKVVPVIVAVALAFTAVAIAKTFKLKGAFNGVPGSTVTLKVDVNKGKPKQVKNIVVTRLSYGCADGTTGTMDFKLPGPFKVKWDKQAKAYLFNGPSSQPGDGRTYDPVGSVAKSGKKVSGSITVYFESPPGNGCANSHTDYDIATPKKK